MHYFIMLTALVVQVSAPAQPAQHEAGVRAAVTAYLQGMQRGDTTLLFRAFDRAAFLDAVNRDGSQARLPVPQWAGGFVGRSFDAATHPGRILAIDITEYTAYAKVELNWPNVRYVDYMSLLRSGDQWKIVQKIWHQESPDAAVKAAPNGDPGNEEAAIQAAVQAYFRSLTHLDRAAVERAFHPDAFIQTVSRTGGLSRTPFQQWKMFTERGPMAHPDSMHNRIVRIDRTGDRAMVKVDLEWPTVHYVDYLSLMKYGGEWRIANKIWFGEARQRRTPAPTH